MKKLVSVLFTVAFVSILAMSLLAQEGPSQNEAAGASSKEKKPQTTRVWNSYVDGWLNYSPLADDPTFNEVSAFTPESAVIVTRIEVDAHVGPINNSTNPFSACATNPSLTLTGGTGTYTLTLATPTNVDNGALHSYTDSGGLALAFAPSTRLALTANLGDANCAGGNEVNVVVHYSPGTLRDNP